MNMIRAARKQSHVEEIDYWRTQRNVLILAHNYQILYIVNANWPHDVSELTYGELSVQSEERSWPLTLGNQ
jgi:hypothetical protein